MQYKLGFLGGGKMAEAIFASLIATQTYPASTLAICEKSAERCAMLTQTYPEITFIDSPEALIKQCEATILAVKPQDLEQLLQSLSASFTEGNLLISIAAGKTLAKLRACAGNKPRLVRVMPNLALMVKQGMSAYCIDESTTRADCQSVETIFSCAGLIKIMPEAQFHAVTALSGSGPAFFAYIMQQMAQAAIEEGLDASQANLFAMQTMLGTAQYLIETQQSPEAFIQAVCSPKGTTEAGMNQLRASAFPKIAIDTLHAAAHRSSELA